MIPTQPDNTVVEYKYLSKTDNMWKAQGTNEPQLDALDDATHDNHGPNRPVFHFYSQPAHRADGERVLAPHQQARDADIHQFPGELSSGPQEPDADLVRRAVPLRAFPCHVFGTGLRRY